MSRVSSPITVRYGVIVPLRIGTNRREKHTIRITDISRSEWKKPEHRIHEACLSALIYKKIRRSFRRHYPRGGVILQGWAVV